MFFQKKLKEITWSFILAIPNYIYDLYGFCKMDITIMKLIAIWPLVLEYSIHMKYEGKESDSISERITTFYKNPNVSADATQIIFLLIGT